jgi:hypothetical protein
VNIEDFFAAHGGLATRAQLLAVISHKTLAAHLEATAITRVFHGVYALEPPGTLGLLAALELATGRPVVACMGTAAELAGFDIENDGLLHVLDPGVRIRPTAEVMVHQRLGAPLRRLQGRLATAPAWTAVEVARTRPRRRVLSTLDAALRSGTCSAAELHSAIAEQKGRRGIVAVRELVAHADPRPESPMESEARVVFLDGGLPAPVLQYEIVDRCGQRWRLDFAWPQAMVAAEYDSMAWHANPERWRRDRLKASRLAEMGWALVPFVVDDVRRHPHDLVARVASRLSSARLAG